MPATRQHGRKRPKRLPYVHKPSGLLHPRVARVKPEHFGIVCVDCAKMRSKWMLCDFFGKVLVEPTTITHSKGDLGAAVAAVRTAMKEHRIKDVVVAVERTGNYHVPVQRVFRAAGFEVRIVHPFATKQFRQPANPGNKTDDNDLAAIQRATVNGFGLVPPVLDQPDRELQLIVRHRRVLVRKCSTLRSQIREHLHLAMPGYAECFSDLWEAPAAIVVARAAGSPQQILELGSERLRTLLREQRLHCHNRTIERIIAWASAAAAPHPDAELLGRFWRGFEDDRAAKQRQILDLERDAASLLVHTPYVLLLSIPGINVVSAADYAGEMGPIGNYANARCINGRAGLYPSRHQSDRTDLQHGELVRCANRRLRTAILAIADNLIKCNAHFRAQAEAWKRMGKDPRTTHVKIASRFTRISYQMVAGRQVFRHPCCRDRSYILEKLITFHREHTTPAPRILDDLRAATEQIPSRDHHDEARLLLEQLRKSRAPRSREARSIGEIIPLVLAQLGIGSVESDRSGG